MRVVYRSARGVQKSALGMYRCICKVSIQLLFLGKLPLVSKVHTSLECSWKAPIQTPLEQPAASFRNFESLVVWQFVTSQKSNRSPTPKSEALHSPCGRPIRSLR